VAQKTPTIWKSNPAKVAGVTYSSSATNYNSASTAYSSSTASLDEYAKTPKAWVPVTKVAIGWKNNPASLTNLYVYDSASKTYDSASDTYDGVVSGQDFAEIKTPTAWSVL
jgi:cytochrome c2